MEYIAKVGDKEYGPVSENVLREWVEDGRVLSDTQVRNSMMRVWKNASEFSFLVPAFEKQSKKFTAGSVQHFKFISTPVADETKAQNTSSEFKNRFYPDRANISLRFKAGMLDLVVVALFFVLSFLFWTYLISRFGINPNLAAYASFSSWTFLTLLYFAGSLGVFAQTLGMWYQGLLLARNGDDAKEVYLLRAYIYALLILTIGAFSPVFNFIGGKKRSLHDFLTDTQIVKISASKVR